MSSDNIDLTINGGLFLRKNPNKHYFKEQDFTNPEFGIRLKENIDYSKMSVFWQLDVNNEKELKVRACEDYNYNVEASYTSITDLKKDYVSLFEFLERATFVGRQFKRTEPSYSSTGHIDVSFMDSEEHIALYCSQDLFLVKSTDYNASPKYRLVVGRYTLDGKYEFLGPVHEEYRDRDKVYNEILAQINEYNKERGRHH